MGIIGFFIWVILPFILCLLLIPKYISANSEYRADYSNPVLIRHIAVAFVPAVIPFLNWFAILTVIVFYMVDYQKIFRDSWLDIKFFDLFKKKEIEK